MKRRLAVEFSVILSLIIGLWRVPAGAQTPNFPPPSEIEARLTRLEGAVSVHPQINTPLEAGDEIQTGGDGSASLTLDGQSLIEIGHNSEFKVESLKTQEAIFRLELGSLVAKIERRLETQQMQFNTPDCMVVIRGTEFAITRPAGSDPSRVGVFNEGHLDVKSPAGEVHVGPREETEVMQGSAPKAARPMKHLLKFRQRMRSVRQQLAKIRKNRVSIPR
jgi:hypothetical protein